MGYVSPAFYRALWRELHERGANGELRMANAELNWLDRFANRIHCPGCRQRWREIVATHPPELASRYTYFRWTVRAHNEVNRSLGKPIMPFAAACQLYRFDTRKSLR